MIIRDKELDKHSKEIKFAVCYGSPDIKKWAWELVDRLTKSAGITYEEYKTEPFSEEGISELLRNIIFCRYEGDFQEHLSTWVFNRFVLEGYMHSDSHGYYYWTKKAFTRPGRKKKLI